RAKPDAAPSPLAVCAASAAGASSAATAAARSFVFVLIVSSPVVVSSPCRRAAGPPRDPPLATPVPPALPQLAVTATAEAKAERLAVRVLAFAWLSQAPAFRFTSRRVVPL